MSNEKNLEGTNVVTGNATGNMASGVGGLSGVASPRGYSSFSNFSVEDISSPFGATLYNNRYIAIDASTLTDSIPIYSFLDFVDGEYYKILVYNINNVNVDIDWSSFFIYGHNIITQNRKKINGCNETRVPTNTPYSILYDFFIFNGNIYINRYVYE